MEILQAVQERGRTISALKKTDEYKKVYEAIQKASRKCDMTVKVDTLSDAMISHLKELGYNIHSAGFKYIIDWD